MSGIDVKGILNEIYQQSLTLGLASAVSMVLQKFMKMSLGTPMSLRPFLMLSSTVVQAGSRQDEGDGAVGGAVGELPASGPIPEPIRAEDLPEELEQEYRNSFYNVLKEKIIITDPEFFKNVYFEPRGGIKKSSPLKPTTINAVKYKDVK